MRIVLVGKAASGKDFFRDWLKIVEPLDVSYTTRPVRDGEIPGYTYHFLSKSNFLTLKDQDFFLEAVEFIGYNYGTSKDNWRDKTIFIMTPSGTECIPEKDRDDCILVYFDIPIEVRKERLSKRSDFDSVERRIIADERDFEDFKDFNIRVTNPNFNVEDLYTTILSYKKCNIK